MPHSRKFILCVVMAVTAIDNISAKGQCIILWQYFVYSMCIGASSCLDSLIVS